MKAPFFGFWVDGNFSSLPLTKEVEFLRSTPVSFPVKAEALEVGIERERVASLKARVPSL